MRLGGSDSYGPISDTYVIDIEPLPGTLVCSFGTGFCSIVGCDSDGS